MDTFARGLKCAAKILQEGVIPQQVKARYSSFETGIGEKIEKGTATFEELETFIMQKGEPKQQSGQQEHYEAIVNYYV